MAQAGNKGKQNLTISLDRQTIRKAKILENPFCITR